MDKENNIDNTDKILTLLGILGNAMFKYTILYLTISIYFEIILEPINPVTATIVIGFSILAIAWTTIREIMKAKII